MSREFFWFCLSSAPLAVVCLLVLCTFLKSYVQSTAPTHLWFAFASIGFSVWWLGVVGMIFGVMEFERGVADWWMSCGSGFGLVLLSSVIMFEAGREWERHRVFPSALSGKLVIRRLR